MSKQSEQSTNTTTDNEANNQPTVNERLDERLDDLTSFMESIGWEFDENGYTFEDNYINFRTADMLRQALTSLIRELVAEAKPGKYSSGESILNVDGIGEVDGYEGYNQAIDQFEQNLLKELEEK